MRPQIIHAIAESQNASGGNITIGLLRLSSLKLESPGRDKLLF